MEYCEGETLAARLSRSALSLSESLVYAIEILDALEQAHDEGIFHCDLKPSNVMPTRSGTKLLDFGIAAIRGQRTTAVTAANPTASHVETTTLTTEDALFGTIHYMAPERLEGEAASASADLFAFGAMLYV